MATPGRYADLCKTATSTHPWNRDATRLAVRNTPKSKEPEFRPIVGARGAKRRRYVGHSGRDSFARRTREQMAAGYKAPAHANAIMRPIRATRYQSGKSRPTSSIGLTHTRSTALGVARARQRNGLARSAFPLSPRQASVLNDIDQAGVASRDRMKARPQEATH